MAYTHTIPAVATAHEPAISPNLQAIGFLIFGVAVFSVQDVIVKALSGTYPLTQLLLIRSLIAFPLLLAFALRQSDGLHVVTHRPWLNLLRCALMFTAFFSFYLAISAVPLAVVVAIAFSSPIVITLISALALREPVGIRRYAALLLGFAGMLLITRPGGEAFEPAALFAVVCAVAYGCAQVIGRVLGRDHSSAQLSVYSGGFYLFASAALAALFGAGVLAAPEVSAAEGAPAWLNFLTRPWVMFPVADALLIASTGVISAVGFVCLAHAYKIGEPSAVAPYEYSGILWALVLGAALWGELPDATAMAGIALIVGSGLYVLWREQVRERPLISRRGRLRLRSGL